MPEQINELRRVLLKSGAVGLMAAIPAMNALSASQSRSLGSGSLHFLSDGYLQLPLNFLTENTDRADDVRQLLAENSLSLDLHEPPCNLTLWQTDDRLVLFDVGSGSQFVDTAGLLPSQLEELGIDPADITDVVLTHAHPDHCWGLLDDFDELLCPDATYHMHGVEFDYWLSEDTLTNTPESGLGFVAGARNRLPLIEPQLKRFNWGDEIIPGIEAVDSHGHTPGHTSFAIHQGSDSLLILGDAMTHEVLSFQRPEWPWVTDQDVEAAIATRLRLLDRMAADEMNFVGFHLSYPGLGRVERIKDSYRYLPEVG